MKITRLSHMVAYLNSLTFSCIQMVLYTTIPYISDKTGVLTVNIIAAISVGSLIFTFTGPFWAAKSDRLGRKTVLGFGMLGMTTSFALLSLIFLFNEHLSLTVKVAMVFGSRVVYGLFCSAIVPVSQAWQLDMAHQVDHLRVLTRNSMLLNLGRILGPVLILLKGVNFERVIYAATIGVLLLSFVNFFTFSTQLSRQVPKHFQLSMIVDKWKRSVHESLLPILLAMVFTGFIGVLHSFLGHHLKTVLNLSGQEASLMFARIILVLSILAILIQQLSILTFKSSWKPRVIIGSTALVAGTMVMMRSNSELTIWFSIVLIAFATALIPPAYLSLTSRSKENTDKTNIFGQKLGLASIAHSFGYALGMALIAISMKLHWVSESAVVYFISFTISLLTLLMITKIRPLELTVSQKA